MEDVSFVRSHSNSPLPEAGNEPEDPLAPEIDEENGANPPIGDPDQDMEVTEQKDEMPDPDDIQEAGLSDNESVLSDAPEGVFDDFDAADIAIEERPAEVIDSENLNRIGVHKRKRAEGEGEQPKKKKKRADKPRRRKNRDGDVSGGDEVSGSRKGRSRKKAGGDGLDENFENLTPEERRKRALDEQIKALMKPSGGSRRRKKDGIDLEGMADAEIEDMRRRMASAAEADNEGRKRGEPARHKLKLLPEVVTLLNKNSIKDSIVDPEINLLEAVRFFLEPLNDGSLPAYDIQKELFAALEKLPITKDSLVASGIGKVIMFYCKSKRPELHIRRQAERLYTDWTRPILKRTDDFRKKEFAQADYDPTNVSRAADPQATQAAAQAAARQKMLAAPTNFLRARPEASSTTYTIVPKSNVVFNENNKGRSGDVDILRKIKNRGGGGRR
ncbi:hypothetical protein BU23DRAFT_574516 [Bimuria novae-zelandiae CBS 107.79]|uniref:TFIIS N-terminal domain-containing protein n=1 Tax=Bimuria novae-zelandiae CBS 107.79 TaxID=1447943 RepID=A0A6A5ULZ8_9PLEO|nr:hypothetical protein BU23DRAFT_574516 [Bimuria novae-zelandiae CBS 107.79]